MSMRGPPNEACAAGDMPGLVGALALAIVLQTWAVYNSPLIAKDGVGFIGIAQRLAANPAATTQLEDQHPGFPGLILVGQAGLRRLGFQDDFQAWIFAARGVSFASGLAIVALVYWLSRLLFDRATAGVAGLLIASLPLFRQNAADALSDSPHLAVYLLAACLAAAAFTRGRLGLFILAGFASSAAFLIRPEGLSVSLVAGVAIIGQGLLCKFVPGARQSLTPCWSWSRRTQAIACLVAGTLPLLAGYVFVSGKLTSKKTIFAPAVPPAAESSSPIGVTSGQEKPLAPLAGIIEEPARGDPLPGETPKPDYLPGAIAASIVELGKELGKGFRYVLLVPLLLGHFAPGRRESQPDTATVVTGLLACHALLLVFLFCSSGYISHRHTMPLVALLVPGTAVGILWLAERTSHLVGRLTGAPSLPSEKVRRNSFLPSMGRLPAIVTLALVVWHLPYCVRPLHQVYYPVVEAATWVRAHTRPENSVLSTSAYVPFFAQRPGALVGPNTPDLLTMLAQQPPGECWSFLVLEVDDRQFDPARLAELDWSYYPVLTLNAHPKKAWHKVTVFASESARLALRDDSATHY